MSGPAPIEPETPVTAAPETPVPRESAQAAAPDACPHVRAATHDDLPAVVAAAQELLIELGSTPPPAPAMARTARSLIDDPSAGALLVAQAGRDVVGVLGASYQIAMHVPGRYVLIQDLWVHPSRRGHSVGGELLAAVFALAREQDITRAEVGLPRERFAGIRATEAFYAHNGFEPLGSRMRRISS
jgi:GNAT superfamily N-acetyltransferase